MKNLRSIYVPLLKCTISIVLFFFITFNVAANSIKIEILGNKFTDSDVILSLIKNKPTNINEDYSNYLLKTLDNSKLFEEVSVKIKDNVYIISVIEFPNINKIYYKNNERIKKDDLDLLIEELKITNLNPLKLNLFNSELKKIYESFGYSNTEITYTSNLNTENNIADLYFDINEGNITKIKNIFFNGNSEFDDQFLKTIIKSKTKTLRNIFANNNFKKFIADNDTRLITEYYINNGYIDIIVDLKVEFLESNKVNLYFNINEGSIYNIKKIQVVDQNNILNKEIKTKLNNISNDYLNKNKYYSLRDITSLKSSMSEIIIENSIDFFELSLLEKKENNEVSIIFKIDSVKPKYVKQINIYGNSRTYDYVIRRELSLVEGDAVYTSQIKDIKDKLQSLRLFKSVEVKEKIIDDNFVNVEIDVEERQTGTVNAGVSIGTIEGFAVIAGLSERNFYGTGRSVNALVNTSEDKTEFTLETTDRLSYENDIDVSYKSSYKEEDFAKISSYKLDTLTFGVGIDYNINPKLRHGINIDYLIKDYKITDESTVSSIIGNSSGENVSLLLSNNLFYNTLNSVYQPLNGRLINFNNSIESPTSSSNGYIKNIITIKNFKKINKNIFSNQTKVGNIISISNNDILTDDKFSLGGRWLRGFDIAGAGPRNSRTSYVGGNNLFVTKFDYSREIFDNSDFPILINFFNDYGLLWENKTTPTQSDNNLRSSVGFGIKYYSPIGPIGFTWGFPIIEEEYDINRMFLFSVGNID